MGLLHSLLNRRSMENPAENLYDPSLWDALGATPSESGVRVNRKTSLQHSPIWRAVNLITRDVAKLPLLVYRRVQINGSEGKKRATDHAAFRLLHRRPNREMTPFVFKQLVQANALLEGNGMAYIARLGDGTPDELIPLLAGTTYPIRINGVLWYITNINGEERRLPAEDVFHVKGLGFDGLSGYPVWKLARDSWGSGIAARNYGARFFRNGAQPSIVLEHPGNLTKEAASRLVESFERMHSGLENSHRVAVLEEGMKATAISATARNSQLIETRNFDIREVANWFNLPPHKLGDSSRTAYASLEQENQSYLDDALDPWLVNWEEEAAEKLLTEDEKESDEICVEFLRQALLQANLVDRANYYRAALGGSPWMAKNEVRALENLNPVEGGDEISEPLNMTAGAGDGGGVATEEEPGKKNNKPAGKGKAEQVDGQDLGDNDTTDPGKDDGDEEQYSAPHGVPSGALIAARAVFVDAARRMTKRLAVHAKKSARTQDELAQFLNKGIEEHRAVVIETITPAVTLCASLRKTDPKAEPIADRLIDSFSKIIRGQDLAKLDQRLADAQCTFPEALAQELFDGDK